MYGQEVKMNPVHKIKERMIFSFIAEKTENISGDVFCAKAKLIYKNIYK